MKHQYINIALLLGLFFITTGIDKGCILAVSGSRIKRSSPKNEYFKKNVPVTLKCFGDNRPDDDDIISYSWRIGQHDFGDVDLPDYEEYDIDNNPKGDIAIQSPKPTLAVCKATVRGDSDAEGNDVEKTRMRYNLIEAKKPTVHLTINGDEYSSEFSGRESKGNNITCVALNGDPDSKVTLKFGEDELNSIPELNSASYQLNFDYKANGKLLDCEAKSLFEGLDPVFEMIKLDIKFAPIIKETEKDEDVYVTVGDKASFDYVFLSNPAPDNPKWGFQSNCSLEDRISSFEERYSFNDTIRHKSGQRDDEYAWSVIIDKVEESDMDRCIYLSVSNSEGSKIFRKKITVAGTNTSHGAGSGTGT